MSEATAKPAKAKPEPPPKPPFTMPEKLPDIVYESTRARFWAPNKRNEWIPFPESAVQTILRSAGFHGRIEDANGNTPVDYALNRLRTETDVDHAGPIAGFPPGRREMCGARFLITKGPKIPEPAPGKWDTLHAFLADLLEDDDHARTQFETVLAWIKTGFQALTQGADSGQFQPGQVLCLAGPSGAGKSRFQMLITEIFGGRTADPSRYLFGRTEFNLDLISSEHLAIEDTASARDWKARTEFGQSVKNTVANAFCNLHAKGKDSLTVAPFRRISISLNSQPEDLMVLPPMVRGVSDKFILLRTASARIPEGMEFATWWKKVLAEVPAFLHWLRKWKIPKALKHDRYGVQSWHHPALTAALDELNPWLRLLELIDTVKPWEKGAPWEGTASDLEALLSSKAPERSARILRGTMATGRDLRGINERHPLRVQSRILNGKTLWKISEPPKDGHE